MSHAQHVQHVVQMTFVHTVTDTLSQLRTCVVDLCMCGLSQFDEHLHTLAHTVLVVHVTYRVLDHQLPLVHHTHTCGYHVHVIDRVRGQYHTSL